MAKLILIRETKNKVNTTVFPLKSFAEEIGGKHVEVESIYPAGTDYIVMNQRKGYYKCFKSGFIRLYWR